MDSNVIDMKNNIDNKLDSDYTECNVPFKEWRNVNGDLDDFIFYYEDAKYLSER